MNCNDIRENLIELLADGPASPEIKAHVAQCSACAQELESLRKTMLLLDEWEAPEPSPYFLTRLKAHAREERETSRSAVWTRLRRPALAVSLAAVLAVGGVTYQMRRPPDAVGTGAGADLGSLGKNHDPYLNFDPVDERAGFDPQPDPSQEFGRGGFVE